MSISDDLYFSVRPTYFLSKAVGFAPFQLRSSGTSLSIYIHKLICIIYLIFLFGLVSNSTIDIVQSFYYNDRLPKFVRLVLFLQIVTVAATNIITWYKLLFHHKSVINILNKISELGIQIELLGCTVPYNKFIHFQKVIIPCTLGYALLNFSQNIYMGENAPGIFILVVGNATMLCEFLCSLLLLREYFLIINMKLVKYGDFRGDGYSFDYNSKRDNNTNKKITQKQLPLLNNNKNKNINYFQPIKQISEVHRDSCNLCRDLNEFYSLPVLLSIYHNIMNLTSICYYISTFMIEPPTEISIYLVVSLSTVLSIGIMSFIQLGVTAYVCSATRREASFTGVLVHGLLNSDKHRGLKHDLEIFSQQILHQRITFTAAGFFVLDFTLINAVIGAVTTYLVILIQFQLST